MLLTENMKVLIDSHPGVVAFRLVEIIFHVRGSI